MNPSSPAIDIQGFLFIYDATGGFQHWQRKWASLCDYCLYLYDRHGDRESRHAFLLPSGLIRRCPRREVDSRQSDDQQLIKIEEAGGKTAYLGTANEMEFDEWYNALQAAARLRRVKRGEAEGFSTRNDTNNNDVSHDTLNYVQPVFRDWTDGDVRQEAVYTNEEMIPRHEVTRLQASRPNPPRVFRPQQDATPARGVSLDDLMVSQNGFGHGKPREPSMIQPQRATPVRSARSQDMLPAGLRADSRSNLNHWPSGRVAIETVKEDPAMGDAEILATKPLEEIMKKYPVSGLAKRMSIAASDLLGKSHDELLISLIQLNREKANLERIRNYYILVLEHLRKDEAQDDVLAQDPAYQDKIRRAVNELKDVEHQIELSLPLITFIDNIVKMGALYAGDDLMFATEYRKNLLSPQDYCPVKSNITFARRVQEKQVARSLSNRIPGNSSKAPSGSGVYDMPVEGYQMGTESAAYRKTREALEQELSELQSIYTAFHGKRTELTAYMQNLPLNGGVVRELDTTTSTLQRRQRRKSAGDEETKINKLKRDNTIKYPRRSTSRQPRSDTTNSLRRRKSMSSLGLADELRGNLTLPRSFNVRPRDGMEVRAATLPRIRGNRSDGPRPVNSLRGLAKAPDDTETTIVATARYVRQEEETNKVAEPALPRQSSLVLPGANGSSNHIKSSSEGKSNAQKDVRVSETSMGNDSVFEPSAAVIGIDQPRSDQLSGSLDRQRVAGREKDYNSESWAAYSSEEVFAARVARGQFSAPPVLDKRSPEKPDNKRMSVQQRLDLLIGDPKKFSDSLRSSHSEQLEKPLVRLTAERYKNGPSAVTRLSASDSDSRNKALDRLGRYYEMRHGLERGSMTRTDSRVRSNEADEEEDDGGYERLSSVVSLSHRRVSDDQGQANQTIEEHVVVPQVVERDNRLPERWFNETSRETTRTFTKSENHVETRYRRTALDRREHKIDVSNDEDGLFDSSTIDKALWIPNKVEITDRYELPSDSESELQDESQRQQKFEKVTSLRRMLASHSLQTWTDSEIIPSSSKGGDFSGVGRQQIEEEKDRRRQLLEVRQSLANEVKLLSRAAARERRRTRELKNDQIPVAAT